MIFSIFILDFISKTESIDLTEIQGQHGLDIICAIDQKIGKGI